MTDRYRGSQLRILRSCHFAYGEEYVKGNKGAPAPALAGGAATHDAVAEASRAIVETGMLNLHEVAFRAVRGGNIEYAQAVEILTRFQEALGVDFDIDPNKVIAIEETLEMPLQLPNGDVVTFFGTPDLVERVSRSRGRIRDWKTHHKPESEEESAADPQLDRYALLINHKYPALTEFEVEKRFIRYRNNFRSRFVTLDDLKQVKLELVTEIMVEREVRAAGVYEATPGDWCSVCAHHSVCPVIRKYRERGADDLSIEDDDRAGQLAGDVVALDAFSARMKDRLKYYLGSDHRTGYVEVSGGTYGYAPVNHREVPAPKLIEILREKSLDPDYELFNTAMDALDRLLKRAPEDVKNAVEAITLRGTTSRCQFRKTPKKKAKAARAAAVATEELL